jgi:hypothetical protein
MNVVAVALTILVVGALAGLVGYFVKRRMDRWADAMIVSFGLMGLADRCGETSLREERREAERSTVPSVTSSVSSRRLWRLLSARLLSARRTVT